jgi:hypothetical protein
MRLKIWEWLIIVGVIISLFGLAYALDEALTVSSTAVTLTAGNYVNARAAIIAVEGNDIRFTLDGVSVPTSGTAGVGIKLYKDVIYCNILTSNAKIKNFKAVRESATADATIHISYQWPQREQ